MERPHPDASWPSSAYAEYDSRKLTVLTGYVAGVVGFSIGLHRIYAKKPLWWGYLLLAILGAVGSLVLVGFVFFGILFLWLLVDLAFMRRWVEEHNCSLQRQVFSQAQQTEIRHRHSTQSVHDTY
ncbi:hypothetical protein [Streptomyces sp. 7N604]|uniref:hypothetical protein n=1 Tax=Streptomyces sp. 7N604 TaxID=3457415 RepID=UPI003FD4DB30